MQDTQAIGATEMLRFEIRAGGDEKGATGGKLMRWRVGPRSLRLGHLEMVTFGVGGSQPSKSGRGLPPVLRSVATEGGHSKTLRESRGRSKVRQVMECASPLAL